MVKVEPKRGLKVDLFTADRLGTNGHPSAKPSRMTYMAHAKGYVMCRHPGAVPFAVSAKDWDAFPLWKAEVGKS